MTDLATSLLRKSVAFLVAMATGLWDRQISDLPPGSWPTLKRSFVQRRVLLFEVVSCGSWLAAISRYVLKFGRNRDYELSGPTGRVRAGGGRPTKRGGRDGDKERMIWRRAAVRGVENHRLMRALMIRPDR